MLLKTSNEFIAFCTQVSKFADLHAIANTAVEMWERHVLDNMSKESRIGLGL